MYFYTQENLRFDVIITYSHAELGKSFVEFDFPGIGQLVKLSKDDFNDFLEIEYDFGTYSLSHAIAQNYMQNMALLSRLSPVQY